VALVVNIREIVDCDTELAARVIARQTELLAGRRWRLN
jgi:hypothetical protein